jgi:hypothetical protein
MRNPIHLARRDKKIVKRFNELSDKKTLGGKRKFTYEYIFEKLSLEFYLSEYTIEKIIKKG